jgi:hypothetical protein
MERGFKEILTRMGSSAVIHKAKLVAKWVLSINLITPKVWKLQNLQETLGEVLLLARPKLFQTIRILTIFEGM